jgi:hypothetical protein
MSVTREDKPHCAHFFTCASSFTVPR